MSSLNKDQLRAAQPSEGVNLVIAGAGTGKTLTLVEKVKNLLACGKFAPGEILVLTFSRKAADEVKERLIAHAGDRARGIVTGTFHSFCYSLLREHERAFTAQWGFRAFPAVLSDERREKALEEIVRRNLDKFLGMPAGVVRNLHENRERIPTHALEKLERLGLMDGLELLRAEFAAYKKSANLLDFGDMLEFCVSILSSRADIRESVRRRFRYVLVDEFQDTSRINFRLLSLLLPEEAPNLFAVGDDWQSIYGFRDARIEYILHMKKFFPGVRVHTLRVNYRSRKEILDLSNKFIKKNRYRTGKTLHSFKGKGGTVAGIPVSDFDEETAHIRRIIAEEEGRPGGVAVLYRNNWQGDNISKTLGIDAGGGNRGVRLMTMHSAKGLEFDTVIVAGVSDRIIPDRSSDLEEERRLFYVALTRARERLYIIHYISNEGDTSRFAGELGLSAPARRAFNLAASARAKA